MVADLLLEVLTHDRGADVTVVETGRAALRLLASGTPFRIVLSDIRLPCGPDGFAVAAAAGERGVPVILMSGDPSQDALCRYSGYPFLQKPFPFSNLMALLDELLA